MNILDTISKMVINPIQSMLFPGMNKIPAAVTYNRPYVPAPAPVPLTNKQKLVQMSSLPVDFVASMSEEEIANRLRLAMSKQESEMDRTQANQELLRYKQNVKQNADKAASNAQMELFNMQEWNRKTEMQKQNAMSSQPVNIMFNT
jgi:hypothetical protein